MSQVGVVNECMIITDFMQFLRDLDPSRLADLKLGECVYGSDQTFTGLRVVGPDGSRDRTCQLAVGRMPMFVARGRGSKVEA